MADTDLSKRQDWNNNSIPFRLLGIKCPDDFESGSRKFGCLPNLNIHSKDQRFTLAVSQEQMYVVTTRYIWHYLQALTLSVDLPDVSFDNESDILWWIKFPYNPNGVYNVAFSALIDLFGGLRRPSDCVIVSDLDLGSHGNLCRWICDVVKKSNDGSKVFYAGTHDDLLINPVTGFTRNPQLIEAANQPVNLILPRNQAPLSSMSFPKRAL